MLAVSLFGAQGYDLLSASYDLLASAPEPVAAAAPVVRMERRPVYGYVKTCGPNGCTIRRVITGYRDVPVTTAPPRQKPPVAAPVAPRAQAGRGPCNCPLVPHSNCQAAGGCNTAGRHAVCGRGGSFCHRVGG